MIRLLDRINIAVSGDSDVDLLVLGRYSLIQFISELSKEYNRDVSERDISIREFWTNIDGWGFTFRVQMDFWSETLFCRASDDEIISLLIPKW